MSTSDAVARFRRAGTADAGPLLRAAQAGELRAAEMAELAEALAASGGRLPSRPHAADIASTGGPGSLTTLLSPLQLAARGATVPKIGVPGRPAGGIDVLCAIPGYDPALDEAATLAALDAAGYAHVAAGPVFAPLDVALFRLRQHQGAQACPPLVVASILAKKIAAGRPVAGLDVRVAEHGNFGSGMSEAHANGELFQEVASLVGMRAVVRYSDASRPAQPFIGRGEALVALQEVLYGEPEPWLARHADECDALAAAAAAATAGVNAATPRREDLRRIHELHLTAQGTSAAAFGDKCDAVRRAPRRTIRAATGGPFEIDLAGLRRELVDAQAATAAVDPDPVGIVLRAEPGTIIAPREAVAEIRADAHTWDARIAGCLSVGGVPARIERVA